MDTDTPNHPAHSHFLSLPAELILTIITHLADDRPALCSLAQTCHYLKPLAEEHIYSTIELLSTDDLRAIITAFSRDPQRVGAVNTLKILYKHHDALSTTVEERQTFNRYVKQMKLLRDWHVESPYDNFKWAHGGFEWVDEDMEEFRQSLESAALHSGQPLVEEIGLAKLEKLIIHSHGADTDFWDLKDFHCLFRHPSLRYLHVSCLNLPSDIPELEPYAAQTPLQTLIFDECELEPRSLGRILSTPKSLKHLTLGENVHNIKRDRGIQPKLSNAPDEAIEALAPVAHSLETLIHIDPKFNTLPDPFHPPALRLRGSGMRNFHKLHSLECDRCSFLHQGIIANRLLAPPNLQTLRMYNPRKMDSSFWDDLPEHTSYTQLPSLRLLEFIETTTLRTSAFLADYVGDFDRTRERHAYAYKLFQHNIDMKMFAEVHHHYGLIPPYLDGEETPVRLCLYDSSDIGFHRVVQDETHHLSPIISKVVPHPASESASAGFDIHILPSTSSPDDNPEDQEARETDHLSKRDVARLRNQIWRTMQRHRAANGRAPPASITMNLADGGGVVLELVTDDGGTDDEEDDEDVDSDDLDYAVFEDGDFDDEDEEDEDGFEEEEEGGEEFEDAEEGVYVDGDGEGEGGEGDGTPAGVPVITALATFTAADDDELD
ncbi:hypothetical protein BU24DRAFT_438464 [Aaosphaeria arxii CBS 175.79]|uniref:F-box domain-containing protein n=1 Tax=Aaosphaeria arxii CBS 175.79 TaxID=1450172 RepID=A0A6A5Y6Y6_9PLEO|nr:uncharacterized protein BU24DRAFT_438464 [Aaosphaeria arxii CBS 175.79]KAF2021322.1 hypothetical protein BU24DRAFT_438464 [Aaosphaeria arxii CBS 175.79]